MHMPEDSAIVESVMSSDITNETIYVGPLSSVEDTVRKSRIGHLVTLINGQTVVETPATILPGRHLRLSMNDIAEPQEGLVPPDASHIAELIDYVCDWDEKAPMLIHCWAGVSRSTAAAFICLCTLNPQISEHKIAGILRDASPTATPNPRLVGFADEKLGRDGRMTEAVARIGRGAMTMEARVFSLPARITD